MWQETHIELPDLPVGKEVTVKFKFDGDLIVKRNRWGVADITTSCGCSSATYRDKLRELHVKYTPNSIPPQVLQTGKNYYVTKKAVTIKYYIGDSKIEHKQVLTFSGKVYDNTKKENKQ